ncbi:MAG: PDZ domain-containing protein [Spirochaetia bacterium]|nr:PDZ domain-containing protein [Spirochaetia bacterium]
MNLKTKILISAMVIFISGNKLSAITVYVTGKENSVKVYETKKPSEADIMVYKAKNSREAGDDHTWWYFTDSAREGQWIKFVNSKHLADIKVYFVKDSNKAKWIRHIKVFRGNDSSSTSVLALLDKQRDMTNEKAALAVRNYLITSNVKGRLDDLSFVNNRPILDRKNQRQGIGVIVKSVAKGKASYGKLLVKDQIYAINGQQIKNGNEFTRKLQDNKGKEIQFTVQRKVNGAYRSVNVGVTPEKNSQSGRYIYGFDSEDIRLTLTFYEILFSGKINNKTYKNKKMYVVLKWEKNEYGCFALQENI